MFHSDCLLVTIPQCHREIKSEAYICFLSGSASAALCHKVTSIMVVLGQSLG